MQPPSKLTDYEIAALGSENNLCDGHARYASPLLPRAVAETVEDLMRDPAAQQRVEPLFLQDFAALAKQEMNFTPDEVLLCPSASIAIEIVANLLRLRKLSVALVEPVFDNLADILARHGLPLFPMREEALRQLGVVEYLSQIPVDAYFFVIPNNPTGYCLSEAEFEALVDFCVRKRKLLILDFSFRFFASSLSTWNQYSLLRATGVQYVAIEDTGKTWPTAELKVSVLSANTSVLSDLRAVYRDIFINHSPIAVGVVDLFVRNAIEMGLEKTVLQIVGANRELLRATLAPTPLRPLTYPNVSVEWIELPAHMSDVVLEQHLSARSVRVLPGSEFYWTGADVGHHFIRVAMMRDPDQFERAVSHLRSALDDLLG